GEAGGPPRPHPRTRARQLLPAGAAAAPRPSARPPRGGGRVRGGEAAVGARVRRGPAGVPGRQGTPRLGTPAAGRRVGPGNRVAAGTERRLNRGRSVLRVQRRAEI